MNSKISSLIATMLLVILMLLQFAPVVSLAIEEVALNNNTDSTNIANVKFDVYFADERTDAEYDLSKEEGEIILFAKVQVIEAGYLDNIMVDFSSCNFNVELAQENEIIQSLEDNKLKLNKISKDEEKIVSLKVSKKEFEKMQMDDLYKVSHVKISGKYTNGEGKEETLFAEKDIKLSYVAELESEFSVEISKYIPVLTVAGNKLMLQEKINSKIANDKMPIGKTKIELEIPEVEGKMPEEIRVVGESGATNGDKLGEKFGIENYSYDIENKLVTIEVENREEIVKEDKKEEFAVWTKDEIDEYLVTFIYDEEVLTKALENEEKISVKANSKIEVLDEKNTIVEKEVSGEVALSGEIGSIVSGKVESKNEVNKGYMITNTKAQEENRKETEYRTTYEVEVGYSDAVDRVEISLEEDGYIRNDREEVVEGSTYIKEITLNKEEVKKLLGEDGSIKLVSNDNELYEINKDTWNDEEDKISLDISKMNLSKLSLVTSNAQEEGKLRIDTLKAIKTDSYYTAEEIEEISKIRSREKVEAYNEDNKISEKEEVVDTEVKGTELKASLSLDREKLTTIKKNEKVKMTAILETNSIDDKLFENPSIEVTVPKSFERVENIEANIYFDDELAITNGELVENEDGTKSIKINLEGIQTKYNLVSTGTVVEIISDITMNKLTPSEEEEIGFKVENSSEEIVNKYKILTESPEELIMTSEVKNENGEVVLSSENGVNSVNLGVGKDYKEYEMEINVLNNTDVNYERISLIGRMPVRETNRLDEDNILNSNIDFRTTGYEGTIKYAIPAHYIEENGERIEVEERFVDNKPLDPLFSESGNVNSIWGDSINNWSEQRIENENGYYIDKSYAIGMENISFKRGSYINLKFNIFIPSSLEYNLQTYMQYMVIAEENISDNSNETDKILISDVFELKTGIGPKISIEMQSEIDDGTFLLPGETFNASMVVKNEGSIDVNDAKAQLVIPANLEIVKENEFNLLGYSPDYDLQMNRLSYLVGEEPTAETLITKEYQIGELKAGQTKELQVTFKTKMISEDAIDKNIFLYCIYTGGDLVITSNKISYNVIPSFYEVRSDFSTDRNKVAVGRKELLRIYVGSTSAENIRDAVKLEINWPEDIEIIDIYDEITGEKFDYSLNNGKLLIDIGDAPKIAKAIGISIKGKEFAGNNLTKEIDFGKVHITSEGDSEGIYYEIGKMTLNKNSITVRQSTSIPENGKMNSGEDFIYTYTIKNEGPAPIDNIELEDYLPKELVFIEAEVTDGEGTTTKHSAYNEEGHPLLQLSIGGNETLTVKIHVRAGAVENDTTITNYAEIRSSEFKTIKTDSLSHIILKTEGYVEGENDIPNTSEGEGGNGSEEGNSQGNSQGSTTDNRRISGCIWVDKNANGERDTDEGNVSNVTVILLDSTNGKIATNSNGENCVTETDTNGDYTFTNLQRGNYMVAFLYNSSEYNATIYHKEGVNDSRNSDAIDTKAIVKNQNRIIALSEKIIVGNENIFNIDLGLVGAEKFDLKLEKTVEEVTLTIGKESKTYKYGTNFAKVDIPAKNQNDATLVVKYKIKVINEGKVSGKVDEIVDYIPKELEYSDSLNKGWYEGSNREVKNDTLKDKELKPGQTEELTLVLTKRMNANGFGLISNDAEITKYSNDLGESDIDSSENNKNTNEDDYSTANLLILVKTGNTVIYVAIILVSVIIIGVSAYFIKKKLL